VAVPAIEKASLVLDHLAGVREPVGFAELAAALAVPRSSLHDVCTSLVEVGLLERGADGRFALGLRLVELARNRMASNDLVSTFTRVCRTFGVQETTVLAVQSGTSVVYVAFIDGGRPLAVRYQIGMRLPAISTATGRSILATLPVEEAEQILTESLPADAEAERARLREELTATRLRGWSVDDEETAPGMLCFGAPVWDGSSPVASGAVAFSMVKTAALSPEACVEQVVGIAAAVSRELGAGAQLVGRRAG